MLRPRGNPDKGHLGEVERPPTSETKIRVRTHFRDLSRTSAEVSCVREMTCKCR